MIQRSAKRLNGRLGQRMVGCKLEQIPQIAVQIFENGHGAIIGRFGRAHKFNPPGYHRLVISPEIIRFQEQEDPPPALIADKAFLIRIGRLGQQ